MSADVSEVEATAAGTTGPPPTTARTFRSRLGVTFTELLLLSSALVLYWGGLNLTRPSPFIRTSVWQIVVAGAYAVVLAVVVALVLGILAVGVDRLSSRGRPGVRPGTVVAKTVLATTLVLVFTDTVLYTVLGASLRSEQGTPAKIAFLILALAPGLLWGRSQARPAARVVKAAVAGAIVLTVAATVVIAVYLNDEDPPQELRTAGPAVAENVLILSSDGLNSKDMSVYEGRAGTTPFLDSISSELLVFENGFSNNGNTTGSITSLLTGRDPNETGVVYPPDALQQNDARRTLPYLLGEEGFRRTSWSVPHYADARAQNLVDAFDLEQGEAPGLIEHLPLGTGPARWFVNDLTSWSVDLWKDALWVEEVANPYDFVVSPEASVAGDKQRIEGVLSEIRRDDPFFINTHFLVSHGPLFPLPEGRIDTQQTKIWDERYYHEAIRVFDEYVREVFQALEDEGKLDSTLVVITSDHGEVFDARQRVPLMIRFPGAEPRGRAEVNAQRLDIAPTVLRALGYEPPDFMTGMDLSDPEAIPDERPVVAMTAPERAPRVVLGYRPRGDELIRTEIVCRSYRQTRGGEVVDEGTVEGSSASCDDKP